MIFYDFEVFKHDWLVVCADTDEAKETVIVNDKGKLEAFYEAHKKDIWCGYNSRNYDTYILKAILLGFNPKDVNDWIIVRKRKGWEYSDLFRKIKLFDYDCAGKFHGLKQLEGFMGERIEETGVSFDLDRPLTDDEIALTVEYCRHDVEQTMKVFLANKSDFDAHLSMLKAFDLPIHNISKTQAQLSALALGCTRRRGIERDEWKYSLVPTLRIVKHKGVVDWFDAQKSVRDYSSSLTVDVNGVPHVFGWGGLHGAIPKPVHIHDLMLHIDVTSFYPSIMIAYDMLSRAVADKSVYQRIYETRVKLKAEGKKAEQAPYKIILNSTYGICKDRYSAAYDPRRANEVCVNGQLLLLDLLERLEGACEIIQSNTDGLIVRVGLDEAAFENVMDICDEWQRRTGMRLSYDVIEELWQKDVNNYVFRFSDGRLERKGAYVKELNALDYDLPIVNKAILAFLTEGVAVADTVEACEDLREFQKIVKISAKYSHGWHNGKRLIDRTFRVFASRRASDGPICKVKDGGKPEKFTNTPDQCFINNGEVKGKRVPRKLNKDWYVDLAMKRLEQFGAVTYA